MNRAGARARQEGRRSDAGLRVEPARQAALAGLGGGGVDRVGGQVALGRDAGMRSELLGFMLPLYEYALRFEVTFL